MVGVSAVCRWRGGRWAPNGSTRSNIFRVFLDKEQVGVTAQPLAAATQVGR